MHTKTIIRQSHQPALNRRTILCGALALPTLFQAIPAAAQPVKWLSLPGRALDIGANGGQVYVIGNNAVPGGFGIFRWNGKTFGNVWDAVSGGATEITVDQTGNPWVVNDQGSIYRWQGGRFELLPGKANDIGAGGGKVFIIGQNPVRGGFGIYRWDGGGKWSSLPGGAVRIAADQDGIPWVVNEAGSIFMWDQGKWAPISGRANDIACNGNQVFVVGKDASSGGFGIHRWNPSGGGGGKDWEKVPGGAVRIAVDAQGKPWTVQEAGQIFWGRD
jgi:hypothetical protein